MAINNFKQSVSNDERGQLDVLNRTSSGLGSNPTNSSGSLDLFSYTDRGKLEIGGLYAEGLEKSGITQQNAGNFLSRTVDPAIEKRQPFNNPIPYRNDIDLSIRSNRVPYYLDKLSPSERMERNRRDLFGGPSIVFPPDLIRNSRAYIALDFYKYDRKNPFVSGSVRDDSSIYLPIPENLTQNFSVKYNPQDLGLALTAVNELDDLTGGLSEVGDVRVREIKEAGERILKYVGQGMAQGTESALGGLVGRQQGQIANPHPSVFFNGVDLRTYNMEWQLVPRSETESETLKELIELVRDKALPKRRGNFLSYPFLVKPSIKGAEYGADYKKAHISSISINYTAAGTSAFFVNGEPVAVQLSLEFSEAEMYLENED